MTAAPDWLTDLLAEHDGWHTQYESETDEHWDTCTCGIHVAPGITLSMETEKFHRDHVADVVWAEIERRVSSPESLFELGAI